MSMSLYYRCWRDRSLTDSERTEADATVAESGQLFKVYLSPDNPPMDDCLLSGSGKPPRDVDEMHLVLGEWLDSLSYLVCELGGTWKVHLDEWIIPWDEEAEEFDLSKAASDDADKVPEVG